jgi:Tol biopolymer transport system component
VGPDDRFPAFSPDGSMVAFTKDDDIWVVPSTSGAPVQVTTDPALDLHPTWSPDGTLLAFSRAGNL